MANSGGLITAPINVETDVYAVLGIAPTANGYDIGNACKSVKVNWGARYKPVVHPRLNEMTDASYKEANYGFRIPNGINLVDAFAAAVNNTEPGHWLAPTASSVKIKYGWYYVPPSGGDASPFRITDFNNYDHNSPRAIVSIESSLIGQPFTQQTAQADFAAGFDVFAPEDFSAFANKYLGIAIRKSNGTNLKFKTAERKINSADGLDVQMIKNELDVAFPEYTSYHVIPFLTGTICQNLNSDDATFQTQVTDAILLPVTENYITITKRYQGAQSYFHFNVNVTKVTRNQITFDVTATNISTQVRTLVKPNIKYNVSAYNDESFWEQEGLINLGLTGSVSVPVNSEVSVVTGKVVNYAAYHTVTAPWYVEVHIYYPNSEGTDSFAGDGTGDYGF